MQRSLKFAIALGCAAASLALSGSPTLAHAVLDKSVPPVGGAVATPPSEIRLTFSEEVVPQFSGAELSTEAGALIATGKPAQQPADKKSLVIPIGRTLAPGVYKVKWHAVSVDTHKTQGTFTFTVGR